LFLPFFEGNAFGLAGGYLFNEWVKNSFRHSAIPVSHLGSH
jgi:hypothetical protein